MRARSPVCSQPSVKVSAIGLGLVRVALHDVGPRTKQLADAGVRIRLVERQVDDRHSSKPTESLLASSCGRNEVSEM